MIYFLSTRGNGHPIRFYLETYGAPLASRIVPLWYDDLLATATPPVGTYCFADVELLSADERARAAVVWEALATRGCRLLNHPVRSLCRYDLLKTLYARGTNRFDVHRAADGTIPRRFPVFLRREHDHAGSRSPLLHGPEALAAAVDAARAAGERLDETLVVEFCDTADAAGIYRKYSAFVVGERILARHAFFSTAWQVKHWELVGPPYDAEERAYVAANPHERQLRELFALAGITYGRIDYSLLGDALQVWEINTNPIIVGQRTDPAAVEAAAHGAFDPPRTPPAIVARLPGVSAVHGVLARRRSGRGRARADVHARFAARLQRTWEALDRSENGAASARSHRARERMG